MFDDSRRTHAAPAPLQLKSTPQKKEFPKRLHSAEIPLYFLVFHPCRRRVKKARNRRIEKAKSWADVRALPDSKCCKAVLSLPFHARSGSERSSSHFTSFTRLAAALLLLRWCQFNHVVNAQDGNGGFGRKAQGLDLGNGRLHLCIAQSMNK